MNQPKALSTLGWGLFCACSWTWCIGMYLPVIMLRQFGWWGFLVFAIPNVFGCAAFGYVLKRATSQQVVLKHGSAMRCFSFIVVVYHMFFVPFVAATFVLPVPDFLPQRMSEYFGLVLAMIVMIGAVVLSRLPTRFWPILAMLVFGLSLVAFAQWGAGSLRQIAWVGQASLSELAWLTPIFAFGFFLCPYLDLTFHRARTEAQNRHAFAIFALGFAIMIVFTCAYAFGSLLTPLVIGHILTQSMFTIAAHLREITETTPKHTRRNTTCVVLAALLVAGLSYSIRFLEQNSVIGEEMYLRLLVFFGLVFPAYVLLFVGPGKTLTISKANVTTFAIVIIAALPLYEFAFLHERAWLGSVALAAIIIWKLITQFTQRRVRRT